MKTRKLRSDGTQGKINSVAAADTEYSTPIGYPALTGIDRKRWKLFCKGRDCWSEAELAMLYQAVLAHRQLDACQAAADGQPILCENARGDRVTNPVFREVREAEKSLQTWLRHVGLTTAAVRAAASKGAGTKVKAEEPDKLKLIG